MSLIKRGTGNAHIGGLVNELRRTIDSQGSAFASADTTNQLISFESLSEAQQNTIAVSLESMSAEIGGLFDRMQMGSFGTDADGQRARQISLESASIVALAAGDVRAYAEKAYRGQTIGAPGVTLVEPIYSGAGGSMDYREKVAMEAFDERDLKSFLPYSIVYNAFAARQDEFGEAFYPTIVVSPDNNGIDVSVTRLQVYNEQRHASTGAVMNFRKKNIIDATVNSQILSDESTRLIPVRQADNSNADLFVPSAVVAPYAYRLQGMDVPTAPLAMGKDIGLLGASHFQPLIGAGVMDSTDSMDGTIVVEQLILQVDAASPGIAFNTSRMPRNRFNKSIEGHGMEMNLQFNASGLIIDGDTKAVDGSVITELAAIAANNLTVRLAADVNGVANLEYGNVRLYSSSVRVVSVHDENGVEIGLGTGVGATVKAAVEALTVAGYSLKVNRTNTNKRTRGLLLDNTVETERYSIPLGAPISVLAPAGANREASDLKSLIAATRIRNSNNAVTQLLNFAEQLEAVTAGPRVEGAPLPIQGMGRHLVTPFFERYELDMEKSINSVKSHEKAADVSSVLLNALRDVAYRMARDSRIQAVFDTISGGTGEKPTLLIGTDPVIVRHLMVEGDTRTFGTAFEKFKVVSTLDERMSGKIVMAFGRDKTDGPDPLNFGNHAWMPELTASLQISRGGSTSQETAAQPRSLHFNNCPVMAVIDVSNLSKVMVDKIQTPATDTTIDQPFLDGIKYP